MGHHSSVTFAVRKLEAAGVVVIVCSVVLWARQTDEALMRVGSFPGALAEVAFYAIPTVGLFLALPRSAVACAAVGGAVSALLVAQWWGTASDRHSTASLGPFVTGWIIGPCLIGFAAAMEKSWRKRARPSG